MPGHLFIAPGDITRLAADAIAYSASYYLTRDGSLYSAFEAHVPGFADWYAPQHRPRDQPCRIGETRWMPLHPDRRPFGVVVVVSTGREDTAEDKARIAVRCALAEAVRRLREEHGRTGRLLVALPAFRVGRGGDRHERLRSARVQVEAAVDSLRELSEVDAAFVTYAPGVADIYREARRQVLGETPDPDPVPAPLTESLLAGECVLFVGAGLSAGAGLPDWSELIGRLTGELGLPANERVEYPDLAQWYGEKFGDRRLEEVIRQTFADPDRPALPTLAHYLLLSLPVRHVLTTNYDDLIEQALTGLKRHPVAVVRQEDVARTGRREGVHVVKLHGDAASAAEIVLTRDEYDQFFHRRPAMALLLESLLLNQTFFFVGYGLRDPNFRQIFSRIVRMLRQASRPAYATSFEAQGTAGAYLTQQWRHKRLNLVGVPGADRAAQELEFLRLLDRLADQVAARRPRLFLAPDVGGPGPLDELRQRLITGVGEELESAVHALPEGSAAEVRTLAEVLDFLTDHGWRPSPGDRGRTLSRLWEDLAAHAADPALRRRLLIAALAAADTFADARRARDRLDQAERE